MFKVTTNNAEDEKFIPILEFMATETHNKLIGAMVMYGSQLINYLIETNQSKLLTDAMNGKLDNTEIEMDK